MPHQDVIFIFKYLTHHLLNDRIDLICGAPGECTKGYRSSHTEVDFSPFWGRFSQISIQGWPQYYWVVCHRHVLVCTMDHVVGFQVSNGQVDKITFSSRFLWWLFWGLVGQHSSLRGTSLPPSRWLWWGYTSQFSVSVCPPLKDWGLT